MSHWRIEKDWYMGSTLMRPLADSLGVQVDKLNFLSAGLTLILVGVFYRKYLHPSKTPIAIRKIFLILTSLIALYFCFGMEIMHMFIQSSMVCAMIYFVPIDLLPRTALIGCMVYQSIMHLIRMYYDFEGYTIDISGSLMMLTQRLTMLAFHIRDGQRLDKCTDYQKLNAVRSKPDLLTYFAYAFDFHVVLCGPLINFNEFEKVTEGRVFIDPKSEDKDNPKYLPMEEEPSPALSVLKKTGYTFLGVFIIVKILPLFPEASLFTPWFSRQPFVYKHLLMYLYTFFCRIQYYTCWKMADAICNSSSYGYQLVNGEHNWDGADNVKVLKLESAKSLREVLLFWNNSTQRWLRDIAYDRVTTQKTLKTFLLSAVWHGFYPGYFLAFVTCSILTEASRSVRRTIRPFFQKNLSHAKLYDLLTMMTTIICLAYTTTPFVLLSLSKSIRIWSQMYFSVHIASFFAVFLLPKLMPPKRKVIDANGNTNGKGIN